MAQPQDIEDPKFEVVHIGPCFYRKLIIPDIQFKCDAYADDYDDEDGGGHLDDRMVYEGDEWVLELPLQAVFHRFIIGKSGQMKKKLEMDSGAQIVVPNREDHSDSIQLRARQKQQIYSAKAQIELLCEKEESKLEFTHFLSIPLARDGKFRQQVDTFRENVVLKRFPGIDASIFMPTKRMHFTLCMLKLHSHAQIEEMKAALQDVSARLEATNDYSREISASMKGIHILTDDPSNVGVVYTTDRSHALQNRINNFADMLFQILQARNLVSSQSLMSQRLLSSDGQHAEIKLHATLMNTKYSKGGSWDGRGERENIDVRELMETFGHIDFGVVRLEEMQLSCLDEMGDDGYYRSLFSIPLSK